MKPNSKKQRYVYLVYCNPDKPLVYAVYGRKKSAINYANSLISYREKNAKEKGYEFGFYHYENWGQQKTEETDFDKREKVIFSTCLKIKDNGKTFTDDACLIQVIRRPVI